MVNIDRQGRFIEICNRKIKNKTIGLGVPQTIEIDQEIGMWC